MENSGDFEKRMKSLDEKLSQMQKRNEMSQLQSEISNLERQLENLKVQTKSTAETMLKRPDPTARPKQYKEETRVPDSNLMPPWCSPINDETPEDLRTPDRFVTKRNKVKIGPATSTPKKLEEMKGTEKGLGTKVKPATFDGTVGWADYRAHFETCAEINGWSEHQKGLYLAVSLRGQAQGVFGNLSSDSKDYNSLVKALEDRFAPPNQTELYRVQLRERHQRPSETLSELGQDIRRLTNLAYPSAPSDLKETLAKEQFIDSLKSMDMRLKVKQARPVSLNDAIRHAVELEAFVRAERARLEAQGVVNSADVADAPASVKQDNEALSRLQSTVERLEQQLRDIQKTKREDSYRGPSNRPPYTGGFRKVCFLCGSENHLQANCPKADSQRSSNKRPFRKPGRGGRGRGGNHKDDASKANSIGSGLFIPVMFGSQNLNCLVDTGATLTVLSTHVWEASELSRQGMLTEYDRALIAASGTPLDVKGKTKISVSIDGDLYESEVVVANIDNDLMMGLDFMERYGCNIDIAKKEITLQGKKLKLNNEGFTGCYRISASEDVVIPARSEMIIKGNVPNIPSKSKEMYLVEPSERIRELGTSLVAKSLVKGGNNVPMRLMNPSDQEQKIHKGTNIGKLCPVTEVNRQRMASKPSSLPKHLTELYERTVDGMTQEQSHQVARLLTKYSSVFSESDEDLGRTGIIRHKIDTADAHPIKQPLRRHPVHMAPEIDKQIDDMLQKNVIQPSTSPWSSGIVLVTKKDGTKRFCVDYRRLNDVTVKDSYPLPRIDDSLEQLAGAQWFSCLDMNSGYWQVELEDADRPKTAFNSRRGLFEFRVMPFGLCNAPATFERLMESVLARLNWQICLIYLDDVIVHGRTFEAMLQNLESVLDRMKDAGLKLKPRKCQLFCKEVTYLGHIVSAEGVKTDPKKTQTVHDWPEPKDITELRSFLGLCSYYRRFIRAFSNIAKPMHKLTEKGVKFVWTSECKQAFTKLKQSLCEAPVLAHPDFTKEFLLDTDASDYGIGAVLSQVIDGKERVVAFASKSLTKAERRYCVTRKELYAVVHFVKYFRHYLYGKQFTLRTDHGSLRWLMHFKNPEGQLARWLEVLSSYDMTIQHRPGKQHRNADALSRKPCKQCGMVIGNISGEQVKKVTTTPTVDLKTLQEDDEDIVKLRQWLDGGEKPDRKEVACEGQFLKALLCQWERLEVREGLVVRRYEDQDSGRKNWQGIVPMSSRREVLKYSHDIKASGHLGVKKTMSRIKQKYYWPGLQNDVKTYVSGCEACTKRKDPNKTKRAPMTIVRSGYPMERIAVDILGEFPQTERGNRYILVVGDYFTKWTECHAMPNMETKTIATILIDQVISRFGVPGRIHSDQGRQFESQLFAEMCSLLQIEKTRTTPYHAMSDGMVERFNKTLVAMLSAFVNENHTDWDEHIQMVMMAYRSAEHETTGFTPNACMLGRETTCPLDLVYEMPSVIKRTPLNQWVWELQERMESAHRLVRQNTGEAMKRQKRHHDGRLSYDTFEVGEKVYVFFPVKKVGCSSKLTSYWRGPYEVRERLSDVLYRVNCGRSGNIQVIHCDRIRKSKSQVLNGEPECPEFEAVTEPLVEQFPENTEFEADFRQGKRERKRPVWMTDYVLSLFRMAEMANTKTTERKAKLVCPSCKETVEQAKFKYHTDICIAKMLGCEDCLKTFATKKTKQQHMRRKHESCEVSAQGQEKTSMSDTNVEDSDDDIGSDPDLEIGEAENLLTGRVVHKKTAPSPVLAPVKNLAAPVLTPLKRANTTQEERPAKKLVASEKETPAKQKQELPNNVVVKCKASEAGDLQTRSITVENNGKRIYSSSIASVRVPTQSVNLGDILPLDTMDMRLSDVAVSMTANGEIILKIKSD